MVRFPSDWLGFPGKNQSSLKSVLAENICTLDALKDCGSRFYSQMRFRRDILCSAFPDLTHGGWMPTVKRLAMFATLTPQSRAAETETFLQLFRSAMAAVYAAGVVLTNARLANVMAREESTEEEEEGEGNAWN